MVNPIHSLATSVANATEAVLNVPAYVGLTPEDPEALGAGLPPQVQAALAEIADPERRYLMTLIVRGDIVPAGVPEGIPGPDLAQGAAGVADYLGRLLEALRTTKADPEAAAELYGEEALEEVDQSIAEIESLLRRIDPSHPALLGRNTAGAGKLDLLA